MFFVASTVPSRKLPFPTFGISENRRLKIACNQGICDRSKEDNFLSRKGKLPVSTWLSHVFPSKNGSGISKPPIPPGSSPVVSLEKKNRTTGRGFGYAWPLVRWGYSPDWRE